MSVPPPLQRPIQCRPGSGATSSNCSPVSTSVPVRVAVAERSGVNPCRARRTKLVHLQRRHDPPSHISKLPFRGCSPKRPCRGPFYPTAPPPASPPRLAVHHLRAAAGLQPLHESPGCLDETSAGNSRASAATSPQPANLRIATGNDHRVPRQRLRPTRRLRNRAVRLTLKIEPHHPRALPQSPYSLCAVRRSHNEWR